MTTEEFLGKTISNFLSEHEVSVLLNFCKNTDTWRELPDNREWNHRTLHFYSLDGEIKNMVSDITNRLQITLIEQYNLDTPPYPDTVNFARMYWGMSQAPHCDDMSDAENTSVAAEYKHRNFGCVIYLNNDFRGGQTYYTEHPIDIDPEPGKLVIHLGDCNHRHGVSKVQDNTRYTLASFWTFDPKRAISGIEYKR